MAWCEKNFEYEIKAYEMMGKQHFYLQDLLRAEYYMDRSTRGKFELPTSKIRELSLIQMQRK